MSAFWILRLASFAILGLPGSASAASFSLNPSADAFLAASNASGNYGGAGALAVSAPRTKGEFDSLLRFDLAGAKASFDATFGPGLWTLNSITLQLTFSMPSNAIFNGNGEGGGGSSINYSGNVGARWLQNDTWAEGTGMPNTPTTDGITFSGLAGLQGPSDQALGTFVFSGATSGNATWSFMLAAGLVADAATGSLATVLLSPGDANVALVASSKSFGTAANRPLLTLDASAVPEPCGSALLACGAWAWLAKRRRDARAA